MRVLWRPLQLLTLLSRLEGRISGKCFVKGSSIDSQPGSNNPAFLPDLLHYPLDRVDWNRESNALGVGYHGSVHSDDVSADVSERSSAVAWVDRGVCLD